MKLQEITKKEEKDSLRICGEEFCFRIHEMITDFIGMDNGNKL
jgi:hypothetical protein